MQPGAPLADVLGRDPRFRESALGQQLSEPQRVLAVGLRTPLTTPERARFDGLGQMRDSAGTLERPGDEQPAQHASIATCISRPGNCATILRPRRRRADPPTRHLPCQRIDSIEGDLPQIHQTRRPPLPGTAPASRAPPRGQRSERPMTYRRSRSVPPHRIGRPRGCYPRAPSTKAVRRGGPTTFHQPNRDAQTKGRSYHLRRLSDYEIATAASAGRRPRGELDPGRFQPVTWLVIREIAALLGATNPIVRGGVEWAFWAIPRLPKRSSVDWPPTTKGVVGVVVGHACPWATAQIRE